MTGEVVLDAGEIRMEKSVSGSADFFTIVANLHEFVGDGLDYSALVSKLTAEGFYV
jgi:hypothetical protein